MDVVTVAFVFDNVIKSRPNRHLLSLSLSLNLFNTNPSLTKSYFFIARPRLLSLEIDFSYRQTAMKTPSLEALKHSTILYRFTGLNFELCDCMRNVRALIKARFGNSSKRGLLVHKFTRCQLWIFFFRICRKFNWKYFWLINQNTVIITFHIFVLYMSKLDIDFHLRFSYQKFHWNNSELSVEIKFNIKTIEFNSFYLKGFLFRKIEKNKAQIG